tara:strand:+ start:56 stop:373 length:318 start_codon:yes stop_codon:yes gene_type:complete
MKTFPNFSYDAIGTIPHNGYSLGAIPVKDGILLVSPSQAKGNTVVITKHGQLLNCHPAIESSLDQSTRVWPVRYTVDVRDIEEYGLSPTEAWRGCQTQMEKAQEK